MINSVIKSRQVGIIVTLIFGLLLCAIWSLSAGAIDISWQVIANTLFELNGPRQDYIIMKSRLPRTLLALLTGASLAISGTIIQALLRNALASPKIIGINSGAALFVCLMVTFLPQLPVTYYPFAAVLGGCLAGLFVYVASEQKGASPIRLALVGIAVGYCFDSGVNFILVTAPYYRFSEPLVWLTGSLWSRGWSHFNVVWPALSMLLGLSLLFGFRLNLIGLGELRAQGLGMNVRLERMILLILATLSASLSVSVVGVLGFVGLMAPHIARNMVGGDHRVMLIVAALVGSFLVVLADAIGRAIAPPIEISAGIVTALLGAPFFVFIMLKMAKVEAP